ncbi:MAG: SLC13 family permease [Gammaproteobacteria bacterium]|nr:SLC13 family permease [Gammaproteobacteria bacterium]
MPVWPNVHALVVLGLVAGAFYLFGRERMAHQTTGFLVLMVLAIGSYVWPYPGVTMADFFANFGHEALVTVCAMLVLVKGLEVTGALQPLARLIGLAGDLGSRTALAACMALVVLPSAFIFDTPLMAILLPVLLASTARGGRSPSQVLLPVNYAVFVGGMATTIGTSTNVLAISVAGGLGVATPGTFDLVPAAAIAGCAGLLFVWLAAPRLLPRHQPLVETKAPRLYAAVLHVNAEGFASRRTVAEVVARTQRRLRIERIGRGEGFVTAAHESLRLQAGDRLYVHDSRENLKEFETLLGATLFNVANFDQPVSDLVPLATGGQQLAEVVITRASPLYQRLLDPAEFVATYQLLPLALHRGRSAARVAGGGSEVRLRAGDVVLVQGSGEAIAGLRRSGTTLVLDGALELPHTDRAPAAFLIYAAVVAASATGLVPISIGTLMGVAAMLVAGCLRWRHITRALNINLIMVIVASLCLQVAMTRTGADDLVAGAIVWFTQLLPVPLVLASMMLAVVLLTNLVPSNAAAVVSVPVGVSMAGLLGVPAEAFVLAVIYAANMTFVSPTSYATNTMIRGAGRYAAADYRRIGIPLVAVMLPLLALVLSWIYGL